MEEWVPNLWTSEQPLVNIATGKEVPQEMVKNLKSLKQIGENAMNEFIARFTSQENNSSQNTYYDSINLMVNLQNSHLNRGFTASISDLPFSKIACDQIIETAINHSSKSTSGLSRKTENVGANETWMRINHMMAALREHLDSVI